MARLSPTTTWNLIAIVGSAVVIGYSMYYFMIALQVAKQPEQTHAFKTDVLSELDTTNAKSVFLALKNINLPQTTTSTETGLYSKDELNKRDLSQPGQ